MDLNNLVTIIPELFLYIIPGYVVVRIKKTYCAEHALSNFDAILQSIVYSFIIMMLLSALPYDRQNLDELQKSLYALILAVIFSFVLVKMDNSTVGTLICRVFNKRFNPFNDVCSNA
ncbi:MAG: hypothetical protein LBU77_01965, partial [Clostridiales bacterium]|nr:hypothetical protein [Clostridiales bacterium]